MTDKRRTLSDADISSRRSTRRALGAESVGIGGAHAARSVRQGASACDADGAPPEAKRGPARPDRDRE
jgi:hypothetical protein